MTMRTGPPFSARAAANCPSDKVMRSIRRSTRPSVNGTGVHTDMPGMSRGCPESAFVRATTVAEATSPSKKPRSTTSQRHRSNSAVEEGIVDRPRTSLAESPWMLQ